MTERGWCALSDNNLHNPPSRIPDFTSKEEEAQWWETHELTDYLDEFQPVEVKTGKNLSAILHVRLDAATLDALRREADETGVGTTTLARMFIKERLRHR